MRIRNARSTDAAEWLQLRQALWPEGSEAEHRQEIDQFFAGEPLREPWVVLVAEDDDGRVVGLAELSLRPYAEECSSSPVAYLEGWFVLPECRRQGTGHELIRAAEKWGRAQGCTEMASDTWPDNEVSIAAHKSAGFDVAGTVICFRKDLVKDQDPGEDTQDD